jgi:hypothetical protein
VLTDNGREILRQLESHPYELFVAVEGRLSDSLRKLTFIYKCDLADLGRP